MPHLPKPSKPAYRPKTTPKGNGTSRTVHKKYSWRRTSERYRSKHYGALCEVCKALGVLTDVTPGLGTDGRPKGATDHIVSDRNGGSSIDERNLMAMCPYHHGVKSKMEEGGYSPASVKGIGGLVPVDRDLVVIDVINSLQD